jgi:hypothetical protein
MRNLLRKPLPWIVLAECAVVATLVIVAWHLVATAPATDISIPTPATSAAGENSSMGPASSVVAAQRKPAPAPAPGLNLDTNFWRLRLAELNHGEASFEALEWKLVHSAMDAAQRYVESVVLPSIARAERPKG